MFLCLCIKIHKAVVTYWRFYSLMTLRCQDFCFILPGRCCFVDVSSVTTGASIMFIFRFCLLMSYDMSQSMILILYIRDMYL